MFYVGQKVVCIDDTMNKFNIAGRIYAQASPLIIKGEVYTISELTTHSDGQLCLKLVGVPDREGIDHGYYRIRFRPVIEKKTDISLFKAMLNKTPQQNKKELLNN